MNPQYPTISPITRQKTAATLEFLPAPFRTRVPPWLPPNPLCTSPRRDRHHGDLACKRGLLMRGLDVRPASMIRIDEVCLSVGPVYMQAAPERLERQMARVVQAFGVRLHC